MKKYFLKKFIPVYQSGEKICVGYAKREGYTELNRNESNIEIIRKVVELGLANNELSRPVYKDFFECDFLEERTEFLPIDDLSREKLYFQYLNNDVFDKKITNTKILIFGAGAGGSTMAYLLAQMGFSHLVVVDADVVNKTDVSKSMVFETRDVGTPKVRAVAKRIKANFNINVEVEISNFIREKDIRVSVEKHNPEFVIKACDPDLVFRLVLPRI